MTRDSDPTTPVAHPRAATPGPRDALGDPVCVLTAAQDSFLDTLGRTDPEAPVPTCGTWHVADLALHLAGIHWWAAARALGFDAGSEDPTAPREQDRLVEIYGWASAHLRATLTERPLDAPAFTLDGPGLAEFWYRRQLHETLVHLVDLRIAGGSSPRRATSDVWAAVWADTVDEVVTVLHPRQVRLGRAAAPSVAVELHATDVHGPSAAIVLAPPVASWRIGPPDAAPDVRAAGPAWALAMLVWGRLSPDDDALTVHGDPAALQAVLGSTLVP
ncbi:maleylpyruvate isomerase N-terminal domain-containing protein [Luteimicrobium sp. NPDC057192]|uniref:maleylpyruvate isomerase N-terminal domain-containing protein n=1 Tax=Luteimicrobium sp. NPDC057192 TaxID=3346042 RepID=UPI003628C2B8